MGTTLFTGLDKDGSRPVLLSIAGFDPSSGAGVTADLKVFAAHKFFGICCPTAFTVQSTQGVRRSEAADPTLVAETLACLADDFSITGIKIGMLASGVVVAAVAEFLEQLAGGRTGGHRPLSVVLDPVLRSSSGYPLLDRTGTALLLGRLLPLATCSTPNREELALLLGDDRIGKELISEKIVQEKSVARAAIPAAAACLQEKVPGLAVLVTGGDLDTPDDFLRTGDGAEHWLAGERVETTSTHGTGCALSSALLCALAAGEPMAAAAEQAKRYVGGALRRAYPVGKGRGPMHHLYTLETR